MRYGCIRSGAQGCETLVNLSPWGSIFQRKTISTYFVFIFYNLNKNVSEGKKKVCPICKSHCPILLFGPLIV